MSASRDLEWAATLKSMSTSPDQIRIAREDGTSFAVTVREPAHEPTHEPDRPGSDDGVSGEGAASGVDAGQYRAGANPGAGAAPGGGAPPGASTPVILVVPAMGVQSGYYGKLLDALAQAGFVAAATELRGHEESGGRTPSRSYDFGYLDLLEDLEVAVARLRERYPRAPIYLLGHSLGGHLSTVFAGYHQIDGLIIAASGSVWWRLYNRRMFGVGVMVESVSRALGYFPGDRVGFAGREARTQMADWCHLNRTGELAFGSPRVRHDPAIAASTVPSLVVSFAGDELVPPKATDGLAAKLKSSRITRVHLGNDDPPGHLRWARRPELVVPHIADWIESAG